jgi:tetratricopeptide (TPR) repeat protein
LLNSPDQRFRGRIYDHDSAVLLYLDQPQEAVRIGKLYHDAFPGEADAITVYATTLAMAGRFDEARAAAEQALRLNETEDTLAGLAKVLALSGDHAGARALYQRSIEKAGPVRRPLRRAALAFLQWIDGDTVAASETVAPCVSGPEASIRARSLCLFVAGVIDPIHADDIAHMLDQLAAQATPLVPAYGSPASLATLVRARARFFGGACLTTRELTSGSVPEATYDVPMDFVAAYHVPFFATWAICEHAALAAASGDRARAVRVLEPVATRAPGRTWLITTLAKYR